MSTKINDDSMSLEIDGRVIAAANFRRTQRALSVGMLWTVDDNAPWLMRVRGGP